MSDIFFAIIIDIFIFLFFILLIFLFHYMITNIKQKKIQKKQFDYVHKKHPEISKKELKKMQKKKLKGKNSIDIAKKTFPEALSKFLKPLFPFILIVFTLHIFLVAYNALNDYISTLINLENFPLIEIVFKALAFIFKYTGPFIIPVIVCLLSYIAAYTLYYVSKKISQQKMESKQLADIFTDINPKTPAVTDSKRKKEYGPDRADKITYFFDGVQKASFNVAKILPKLLIVVASLIAVNTLFIGINKAVKAIDDYKKIQEYKIIVKNLGQKTNIAEVTLIDQNYYGLNVTKTYNITFLALDGSELSSQQVTLNGKQLYFDCMNINFEYTLIEDGTKKNIAYPYRVYSSESSPEDGIELRRAFDENNIPIMFNFDNFEAYGITKEKYNERIDELFTLLADEQKSREFGIRSFHGNAPHANISMNETWNVQVNGSGGVSFVKKESL